MSEPSQSGSKMTVSAKDLVIICLLILSLLLSAVTLGIAMVGGSQRYSSSSNSLRVDEPIITKFCKIRGSFGDEERYERGFEIKNGFLILRKQDSAVVIKFPLDESPDKKFFEYRLAK